MHLELDHIVVATADLAEGEAAVSLPWTGGGKHAAFGTHNRLLGLGASDYVELISVDPDAPPPSHKRWYNLDRFSGPTRVSNWVLRTDDIEAALARFGPAFGRVHLVERDGLQWKMAVPESGIQPFDGCAPALIQWLCPPPSERLPESGLSLYNLTLRHPEAADLSALLEPFGDQRVRFEAGPAHIAATLMGPNGALVLPS